MRIAIILKKDSADFKGEFLSAYNRTKYISQLFPDAVISPYLISQYDSALMRLLLRRKSRERVDKLTFGDIDFNVIWHKSSLIDIFLSRMMRLPRKITLRKIRNMVNNIEKPDLIIAHSFYSGYLALQFKEKYNIPYTVTWHGSDIHTSPFSNRYDYEMTKKIIANSDMNFFVSQNLLELSERIYQGGSKQVLYNGVDTTRFKPMDASEITILKESYGFNPNAKSVAFIGNLFPVKNAMLLPDIFVAIKNKYEGEVEFHIIGDGFLKDSIIKRSKELGINIKMWGNLLPDEIPHLINCLDLVVLPSKNEGLPLITLETMACEVPIIGSNVGGIVEAIGKENTIDLGHDFVDKFSDLACVKLNEKGRFQLNPKFTWSTNANVEAAVINRILPMSKV